MHLKRLFTILAVVTLMVSTLAFSTPAAAKSNASRAASICRQIDGFGVLDFFDANRGNCVNVLK